MRPERLIVARRRAERREHEERSRKLQIKIFILFVAVGILMGAPLLWTVQRTALRIDRDEILAKGALKAVDLAGRIAPNMHAGGEETILPALQEAQEQTGALYAEAIDLAGQVLAHTNVAEAGRFYRDSNTQHDVNLNKPAGRAIVYKGSPAMEMAAPVWSPLVDAAGEDFLLSGSKESSRRGRLGVVRIAMPMEPVLKREHELFTRITAIIVVVGGVGILLLFGFIRQLLKPIRRLSEATARVAQGDYGTTIEITSEDELGDLTKDFNRMSQALSETTVSKKALEASQRELTEAQRLAHIGNYQSRPDLSQIAWSDEMYRIFGRDPRSPIPMGSETSTMFTADSWQRYVDVRNETLRTGAPYEIDLEIVRPDGVHRWVTLRGEALRDDAGKIIGIRGTAQDNTERKRAQDEMAQSRQMLQMILDNIPQRVFWKDRDCAYLGCNQAFANDAGLQSPSEIIGKSDFELAWKATASRYREDDKRVMEQDGARFNFEEPQHRPDGSILWLRTNKMPLHDTQGHVIGIVGTYEDITDRKQMQDLLEKKERYFRSLIENTSDLITVLDVDGYIRYESPSINRVLGFDPQQMYGKKAMEFVHPEDQEMVLSILSHAIGHPGTPASCEYRFQARDGSWKILHSVGSFLPDDGTGARIVVNSRDITDRRRTDEELRFRNVLLSTQSESSPDGILVVDAENRIAMRNQRFIQMWNVPADLAQSMSDDPILTHILSQMTNANEFVERVNYLYEHREEISREEIKLKDGRLFERYTAPMLGPNEKYYGRVWFFRDISERRKLESAMRQSEKLSAVGQLAAGVAHEINNPLGVILGFAQAIARRVKPGDSLELPLKSIEREAVRCKNLVQDLLTFSRASRLEREPIDLNRAITSALSLINAQARVAHVEVKQEFDDELPHVLGNMNQIQQVVINLTNNAMDAMKDGGLLTIKTERYVDGPLTWACLWIIDNGPGIPLDIQPRIFEPFFTTKPVGKGTGLGLSLVHEIVQKLSGTIHMKSEPGRTEFCVKLPIRNPPTGAPERRASKDPL